MYISEISIIEKLSDLKGFLKTLLYFLKLNKSLRTKHLVLKAHSLESQFQ